MTDQKCNGSIGTGYFANRCQSIGTTPVRGLLYCAGCALLLRNRLEARAAIDAQMDAEIAKLTAVGAKAWAGVDPQKLREGGA